MPSTYTLIASNVLSSSASSVTFSSIPNTYTDLAVRVSGRSDDSSNSSNSIRFFINSNTGTVYSFTRILGNGTSVASYSAPANTDELYFNNGLSTALSTANTFGNAEIYIPNYTSSTNKPVGSFQVAETNSSPVSVGMTAGSIRITSAITTIQVTLNPTYSFVTGSSFYLYGIKNS
jgi:hypothetical protein